MRYQSHPWQKYSFCKIHTFIPSLKLLNVIINYLGFEDHAFY